MSMDRAGAPACARVVVCACLALLIPSGRLPAQPPLDFGATAGVGPPLLEDTVADHSEFAGDFSAFQVASRWTVTADAILLTRTPAHETLALTQFNPVEVLNAEAFNFNWAAGPRVGIRRAGEQFDLELIHFDITGWSAFAQAFAPPNIKSATPPGSGLIIFDGSMDFTNTSQLYSTEANCRHRLTENITALAGFRWVEFRDRLQMDAFGDTYQLWTTRNHLYGGQVGLDCSLIGGASWELGLVAKAGLFGNAARGRGEAPGLPFLTQELTGARVAFLGEVGLHSTVQLTERWAVRCGYQVLWLQGIALAPDQVPRFDLPIHANSTFTTVGGLFAHGASIGLEAAF